MNVILPPSSPFTCKTVNQALKRCFIATGFGNIKQKLLFTLVLFISTTTLCAAAAFKPHASIHVREILKNITVSGRVTDDQDMALPGVSVKVKEQPLEQVQI